MSDSNLPIIVVCSEGAKNSQEIIDSKCSFSKIRLLSHVVANFNLRRSLQ